MFGMSGTLFYKKTEQKNEVMQSKANQMTQKCKWYALERDVKAFAFYKDMANSEYIKINTLNDPFIKWIQNRKWHLVFLYHSYYKCKVTIANLLSKKH